MIVRRGALCACLTGLGYASTLATGFSRVLADGIEGGSEPDGARPRNHLSHGTIGK